MTIEHPDFVLFNFAVGQTIVKDMTFEEVNALIRIEFMEVQFDVPTADLECFRRICGFEYFNPNTETFAILKSIYGLNDVPRP